MQIGDRKFIKTKFDTLDGKVKVAFTSEDGTITLVSSRQGMEISGKLEITTEAELDELAQLISSAWPEHRKLKPKIHTSLSGH